MISNFQDKTAVVTGAASGIGRALSRRLAAEGMCVVLADVEAAPLAAVEGELRESGAQCLAQVIDVSDPQSLVTLAAASKATFGAVHLLCNNAGVLTGGRLWESPMADFHWQMDVNCWGILHGVQAFVPLMLEQGGEELHIVNTASMAALTTLPFSGGYHISKHAALALSEVLYKELQAVPSKIGVSALCPELVNTRISERDRHVSSPSDEGTGDNKVYRDMIHQATAEGTATGLDPSIMAERIVRAVREDRFYILAEDGWRESCNVRLREILAADNPTLHVPEDAG